MRTLFNILLLSSSITLVGCVTTPKQPLTFNQLGQYQEIPLNASSYRVSFKAAGNLTYGNAEEITLLKSAQITVQQGFDFFKVIDDPSNRLTRQPPRQAVVYPDRGYSPFYGPYGRFYRPYWNDPFFDTPYVVNVDPVEVSYTIQMFKKAQAPADAFEAKRILQSLGGKYGLSADGTVIVPQNKNKP